MSGKKNLIIMISLAAAGFVASFVASMTMSGDPTVVKPTATPGAGASAGEDFLPAVAGMPSTGAVSLNPTRKLLNDLIREVKAKQAHLTQRERAVATREKRLESAEKKLKELAKQAELQHVQTVASLKTLQTKMSELDRDVIMITKGENAQLTKIAEAYSAMDPTQCAQAFVKMWTNNQIPTVVKLLGFMEARRAAKVLNEIIDIDKEGKVSAELVEKWKRVRQKG